MDESRLQELINYAYHHVSHYKKIFDQNRILPDEIKNRKDLERVPVLTKSQLQKNPGEFLAPEYMYFPKNNDLIHQRTSGSTGKILKIYWDKQDSIKSLFYLWKLRSRTYGIDASSKYCSFHSTFYRNNRLVEQIPESYLSGDGRQLSFSKLILDDAHLEKFYKELMAFDPDWFYMQPSVAYLLSVFVSKNGLEKPKSLRYIELTGEYLFDHYRKEISKTFAVPVANMYGCMEANGIAMECRNGHMHCLSDNVAIEVLRDGSPAAYGEEGEIYITSLYNRAMPFIRYQLGDRVKLYPPEKCGCGNKNPVMEVSAGRLNENVLVEGREPINSYLFVYSIESINIRLGYPVLQFQIIQESSNRFTAHLVLEDRFSGWKETVANEFIKEMMKLGLNTMEWQIEFKDHLVPNSETGKLQFFTSRLGQKPY